jgi:hypothetical protein
MVHLKASVYNYQLKIDVILFYLLLRHHNDYTISQIILVLNQENLQF